MTRNLPEGWAWATPDELAAKGSHTLGIGPFGSDLKVSDYTEDGVPLVFVRNIRAEAFGAEGDKCISPKKAEQLRAHTVLPGDLLITKMGDPPGDACLYPPGRPPAVMTADCIRLRLNAELGPGKYFLYAARSPAVQDQVHAATRGVAQKKVSLERFKGVRFPLAPPEMRQQIADYLDSQFSRIDAGVAALERVQANLKRYRASVLKAACEGRLVPTEAELARKERRDYEPASVLLKRILVERRKRWEEAELAKLKAKGKPPPNDAWKKKYEEPKPPDTSDLPELPEGWCWATVEQLAWDSSYGSSAKCSYDNNGPPVLRIPNVVGGEINVSDLKRAAGETAQTGDALAPGDFLVIRTNGSKDLIGRAALVRRPFGAPHYFASYLIRFRLVEVAAWVGGIWDASTLRARVLAGAATSAGQYNVSQTHLARVAVALPPADEQKRVLSEAERLLTLAVATKAAAGAAAGRASSLRQSILRAAFSGELLHDAEAE